MALEMSLKHADFIITNSQHTLDSFVGRYNWPKDKIAYTHLGGSEIAQIDTSNWKEPFDADGYVLAVGSHVPRKNYDNLIRAFALAKAEIKKENVKLVFAGQSGLLTEQLRQLVKQLDLGNSVEWLGYVTEEEKAALYRNALCTVVCSWHEGFGIPIIEAMSCGCPVVCSNVAALPEIAGDAALYCAPSDIIALADCVFKIVNNRQLQELLTKKALRRSHDFTWQKCAENTTGIYSSMIS